MEPPVRARGRRALPWPAAAGRGVDLTGENRTAYVTGAGGGIGLQIALDLVASGVHVTAVDLKPKPEALAGHESRVTYLQQDVADEDATGTALRRLHAELGRLDYVVNAAGVGWFDRDGSIVEIPIDVWRRVLDINLSAAAWSARHAVPLMRPTGGAFVHIASVAGLRNSDDPMDAYQVSKAGLCSLSRAIALQFGPDGIRSNTICPGAVLTPMVQPLYQADPARKQRMADRVPLRRVGTPQDISNACMFLLSDGASFITGIDLLVDGGWLLSL